MRYAQHRSSLKQSSPKSGSKKSWKWLVVLFVILGGAFVWLVFGSSDEDVTDGDDSEASEESLDLPEEEELTLASSFFHEADLEDANGSGSFGTTRRGISGTLFSHVVVATLPEIDRELYFYEGWLVEPGVTEFFSTGEMFPREDGKWALVWEVQTDEARTDLVDFTKVVITREQRDGDTAPSLEHVLEGEFD